LEFGDQFVFHELSDQGDSLRKTGSNADKPPDL
jgi:hypothetical protein